MTIHKSAEGRETAGSDELPDSSALHCYSDWKRLVPSKADIGGKSPVVSKSTKEPRPTNAWLRVWALEPTWLHLNSVSFSYWLSCGAQSTESLRASLSSTEEWLE